MCFQGDYFDSNLWQKSFEAFNLLLLFFALKILMGVLLQLNSTLVSSRQS